MGSFPQHDQNGLLFFPTHLVFLQELFNHLEVMGYRVPLLSSQESLVLRELGQHVLKALGQTHQAVLGIPQPLPSCPRSLQQLPRKTEKLMRFL